MDKPAVIEGCYVDLKFMPGIKCARVSIDIPIEHSNAFLKMFDAPDRANPVPVVVARLATSPAEQPSSRLSGDTENGPDKHELCQEAGRLLGKADFRLWLCSHHQDQWNRNEAERPPGEVADATLKDILGIDSKCDLDRYEMKGEAWKRLKTDFDMRSYK